MVKEELIRRSPLRILERSIHGGVGAGNIGVVAAPRGTGKTACLVHIGTDHLLENRHVIHVSFADRVDHIVSWYEGIFGEVAARFRLDDPMAVHDEAVRNRVIMNFSGEAARIGHVEERIEEVCSTGGFEADTMLVDGYDPRGASDEEIARLKEFAAKIGLEVWFSVDINRRGPDTDPRAVPPELETLVDHVAVLIVMDPSPEGVRLHLIKDRDSPVAPDMHLLLDPMNLLIVKEG